jgi:transcriptional regulator GlxA family with amidase domain
MNECFHLRDRLRALRVSVLSPRRGGLTARRVQRHRLQPGQQEVEHPELRRAVRLVRERLGEPFGVEALVREASVSRRTLETLFRRHLHCTPHRFIERARVERARELLGDGMRRSLKGIARAAGFASTRRLNQAFRRVTGRVAREFRGSATPRPPASSV